MAGEKPLTLTAAHPAGLCDLTYFHNSTEGKVHLVTCGIDGKLCYRSSDEPSKILKSVEHSVSSSPAAYTSVSVSAKGVAVSDVENFVKIYSFPDGDFKDVATRFTLPAQAVAYSPSGSTLAAAGDDEGIKLINAADRKVFRTLRSQPYTRGLAFDPEGKYVASIDAAGTLSVWDIATGKAELQEKKLCPKLDVGSTARSRPSWLPDGSLLAAPGLDKDILLFERLSWKQVGELKGGHSGDVRLLAYSKNGLYLASAAADESVVVWDALKGETVAKRLPGGAACGICWHPTKNQLAIITEDGELAVWDEVIPSDLPDPITDPDLVEKRGRVGQAGVEEGEGMSLMGDGGSDEYDREDSFLAEEEEEHAGGGKRSGKRHRGGMDGGHEVYGGFGPLDLPRPQEPIQPGSTLPGDGGRRYLAFNSLGCITLRSEGDHNAVEVTFHDTARMRRRIPLFKDFYNLSMASLGEKGALYGSKSNPDSPSTVLYQPFESWAPNSDWVVGLPAGEEVECVAAGHTFCAVATSARQLRLFSQAGLQRAVVSLGGAPVALAGQGHQLAAVWHAAPPTPAGDQMLAYAVYDVAEQREVAGGALPLSPGAALTWLGFSEEGVLASYDSKGELRMRSHEWGGGWVPLFSSDTERKGSEAFWVFGVSAKNLHCIVVSGGQEPAVPPAPQRPLVSTLPLRGLVVGNDAVLGPIEADLIRHGVLLSQLVAARDEGGEAAELDLGAQQLEGDKLSLKLITKLITGNRHARALEAASQLHTMQALEGALKLANSLRASALADRLSAFIDQRLALEAQQAATLGQAAEEEEYMMMAAQEERGIRQQGEAVTPVHGASSQPTREEHEEQDAAPPSAGAKSSRASPALERRSGAAAVGPFARKFPGAQNTGPNSGPAAGGGIGGAVAGKRKAQGGNPFARKAKTAKD